MTVAEARAYCAELEVRPWDDGEIAGAVTAVTAALLAASPQVTPVAGAPGTWWVGASGFDASGGESALARALMEIAGAWHPRARVAIADSCVAAQAATWAHRGAAHCIVPPGACARYLARAPLALIPMDDEVRAALFALGLRTAGALAELSAADVERRWGELGLAAWRLARGDDRRRPILARPEARRVVTAELSVPAVTAEPVLFLIRAALDRLVTQLVADGRTAAILALTLTLDSATDGTTHRPSHTITRQAQLARPVARVAPLLEQCRALLDRFSLSAPIVGVTVAITATAPATGEQGNILDPTWRDPAAVDAAFARLRAELGAASVVRPLQCDDHRPEHTATWTECATAPPPRHAIRRIAPSRPSPHTPTPRRLLISPEQTAVVSPFGRPVAIHWRTRRTPLDLTYHPDRLSGAWWSDEYNRDYWYCTAPTLTLIVFVDHTRDAQWYVQGWYD
jgi:protein ImuB